VCLLFAWASLSGCAVRGQPASALSPRRLTPNWDAGNDRTHWAAVAERYAQRINPEEAPLRHRLRLASLWERAGASLKADQTSSAAFEHHSQAGGAASLYVVDQREVEHAFFAGRWVGLVRRVEGLGSPVHRIELWSLEAPEKPQWIEYSVGQESWVAVAERFVRSGLEDPRGRVDPNFAVVAEARTPALSIVSIGRAIEVEWSDGSRQTLAVDAPGWVRRAEADPSGRFVSAIVNEIVLLFDLVDDTEHLLRFPREDPSALLFGEGQSYDAPIWTRFSSDSSTLWVLFANGDIITWSTSDGSLSSHLEGSCTPEELQAWLRAAPYRSQDDKQRCAHASNVAFSSQGDTFATTGEDSLRVRRVDTGVSVAYRGASHPASDAFAFNADGALIHAPPTADAALWSHESGWTSFSPRVPTSSPFSLQPPRFYANRVDIWADGKWARWDMTSRTGRYIGSQSRRPQATAHHYAVGKSEAVVRPMDAGLEIRENDTHHTLATVWSLPDGGWFALSEAGAVDGTQNALDYLVAVFDTPEGRVVTLPHWLWNERHTPGVVGDAIRGINTRPDHR